MSNNKKLSPEQIEEIKALKKKTEEDGEKFVYAHVAKMYGVSGPTIRRIVDPTENDMKSRTNDHSVSDKYVKKFIRVYRVKLNTKNPTERSIINKLDSLPNKQGYIKSLLEKDLSISKKTAN